MIRVSYISIKNFKIFGKSIRVDLANPTVLIGPNNSGKTSILQAFALWSLGLKTWNNLKGKSKGRIRYGVPINRFNLYQLPVQNARFLWNNCEVREGSTTPIVITITLGLEINNCIHDCSIEFTQNNSELIYCKPIGELIEDETILEIASNLNVNLLYSMSGIAIEEVRHQPERVNYLMGQGMTSEVLRNLCYGVYMDEENPHYWQEIVKWMEKLFDMHIQNPQYIAASGLLNLTYKHHSNKKTLDIASAGRGALQILLLLTYMYSHKSSIILVDEPDAHLEIIKQKTVYALLSDIAAIQDIQLVIATHSEVVLNEAVDNCISMILAGETITISDKNKEIKPILKEFGVEHYYKAAITKNILYVEGSTDISMLNAFATLLNKTKVSDFLNGELNYYYTQNPCGTNNIENRVERIEGYYNPIFVRHFSFIKKVIQEFIGVGIFDSDANKNGNERYPDDLFVHKWSKYELENYFVTLDVLDQFFVKHIGSSDDMYYGIYQTVKKEVITKFIFDGDEKSYNIFISSPLNAQELLWNASIKDKKMSAFVELLMDKYVENTGATYPMRKGEYYKLISYMKPADVNQEIIDVLNLIEEKLC